MFFEQFRQGVGRYAEGVHVLSPGAREEALDAAEERLERPLPLEWRAFYRSWDGARLFGDSFVLEPTDVLTKEDAQIVRAGASLEQPLVFDGAGRLYEVDELGDRVCVGSTLERWLAAIFARESLVFDREGEYKDVFASGEAFKPEVRKKRIRAALKADPDAAAWHLEAAELAVEEGDVEIAEAALACAVACDPSAGVAWELLGGLHRRAGRTGDAERAFEQGAEATQDPLRKAERSAEAARTASEAGRDADRARHAASALRASADTVDGWPRLAKDRLIAMDLAGAHNLATLFSAVRPGAAAEELAKAIRMRQALRPL